MAFVLFLIACVLVGALVERPWWIPWLLPAAAGLYMLRWVLEEAEVIGGQPSNPPEVDVAAFMLVAVVLVSAVCAGAGRLVGRLIRRSDEGRRSARR